MMRLFKKKRKVNVDSYCQLEEGQLFYNEMGLCSVNVIHIMYGYLCDVIEPFNSEVTEIGQVFTLRVGDKISYDE